jgi:hypothetical protein
MAFNPFHAFRKHSKVVFAGLTILCMATFVLSGGMGGKGDFFTTVGDWLSGGSRTAAVTVYGKNYSGPDVNEIAIQRRMANQYMDYAVSATAQSLFMRYQESASKLDRESQGMLEQVINQPQLYSLFRQMAESEKKTDVLAALDAYSRFVSFQSSVMSRRQGEMFFGLTDRDRMENTADFIIWRQQANRLGIRLAPEQIKTMIEDETYGAMSPDAGDSINRAMREGFKGAYSVESLYAALADEFRVRMAQLSLTGTCAGVGRHTLTAAPTDLTPEESWTRFKDARTTVRVGLIDVPVKDFVAQVKETPAEDDLRKLFEKYKTDEPDPGRELPAFKEPRKIQVTWVGGGPDLPFYQKAADTVLAVAPGLRLLGDTMPVSGFLMPVQLDAELLEQEKTLRQDETPWWEPPAMFRPKLHGTSVDRAENVATLVGAAISPAPAAGILAMQAAAARRDAEVRAKFGVEMIGLAAATDPMGLFSPAMDLPKTNIDQLRPQLREKAKNDLLTGGDVGRRTATPIGLVAADLSTLRAEVMKLGADKGKDAVEKYVADFVKTRGLETGKSAGPDDQYHAGDDPGLAPLKQVYQKVIGQRDLLLRGFGRIFFESQGQPGVPDKEFVGHQFLPGWPIPDNKQYHWWRTDDIPPKTPKYDAAKPEVIAAWKLAKARELAKKEAERILEAEKKTPREVSNLRDVAVQNGNLEFMEIGPMALYMPQLNPTGMGQVNRTYESVADRPPPPADRLGQIYNIPADRIAYPDVDMLTTLLKLREQPKGATAIVSDRPKKNFYVATLLERREPPQDEFLQVYRGSMARTQAARDPLLLMLARGRPEEYRKAVLKQLRDDAKVDIRETAKEKQRDNEG